MENLYTELLEVAKTTDKKTLCALKTAAAKCYHFDLAAAFRKIETERFPSSTGGAVVVVNPLKTVFRAELNLLCARENIYWEKVATHAENRNIILLEEQINLLKTVKAKISVIEQLVKSEL